MQRARREILRWGLLILLAAWPMFPQMGHAQDFWVQVESLSQLNEAERRVRSYTQILENVYGFRTTAGSYVIALGPYDRVTADDVLQNLIEDQVVPSGSFVREDTFYASRFFPIGPPPPNIPETPQPPGQDTPIDLPVTEQSQPLEIVTDNPIAVDPVADFPTSAPVESVPPAPDSTNTPSAIEAPEETPQQARLSEAELDQQARENLQIALQWFGFYNSGIDGVFGPGTRGAMRAWQTEQGVEPTGILTTRQRTELLNTHAQALAALGMRTVRDDRIGVEIDLPLAMVRFSNYNYPFARFDSINESGVQVLLISQPGGRATLEIVPPDGERRHDRTEFLLTGQSDTLRSHTEARLTNGAVKGFTLVWSPERDDQIARVLPMMQDTLRFVDGVLDPVAGFDDDVENRADLMAGLEIRRPTMVRSGFFVNGEGGVVTTADIAETCDEILIGDIHPSDVVYRDPNLGVIVLESRERLAPRAFAEIAPRPGRVRSEIAVAGYPFDGALNAASMSFGTLADPRGINGETTMQRLTLSTNESEVGGPVLDLTGAVVGMVLPNDHTARALPADVTLALRADTLAQALGAAGTPAIISDRQGVMNRETLARLGADMTVTISCWN